MYTCSLAATTIPPSILGRHRGTLGRLAARANVRCLLALMKTRRLQQLCPQRQLAAAAFLVATGSSPLPICGGEFHIGRLQAGPLRTLLLRRRHRHFLCSLCRRPPRPRPPPRHRHHAANLSTTPKVTSDLPRLHPLHPASPPLRRRRYYRRLVDQSAVEILPCLQATERIPQASQCLLPLRGGCFLQRACIATALRRLAVQAIDSRHRHRCHWHAPPDCAQ
mmetsp:Transcript_14768/g.30345  ORF Transcript_14768/g.30345 Transcript_14768/m.30345 type:complete len:222 (-) Transcript_14768:286-951(-)